MKEEYKDLNSKQLVQKLTDDYYNELNHAKENGQIVAWASSIVPQEFMEAMDIKVAYPENHAAAIAAKGGAIPFLEKAEQMGYSNDICSYARINLAYAEILESDLLDIPRPDFVVCMTNICNTLIKWYENLAAYFNVPFILIDVPYNTEYEVADNSVRYIVAQFKDFIKELEKICGHSFDYKKFNEVMGISRRAAKAWVRASDYSTMEPSPLDGFNMFNYMALIVCLRGREESVMLFDLIAKEMEEMAKNGESQFKANQKHRVMWEGIACWPYLGHNYKTLRNSEIIMTGSTYPESWHIDYAMNDIEEMTRQYALRLDSASLDKQIDMRVDVINHFSCDGVVYHINRSCKVMNFMQPYLRKQVFEKTQVPYTVFDGDQSDPNNFSKAQFETRVQALAENMESIAKEAAK